MNLIDNLKERNTAYEVGQEDGSQILELVERTELKHIERNELAGVRLQAGSRVFFLAFVIGLVCYEAVIVGFNIDLQTSNPVLAISLLFATFACGMVGRIVFGLTSDRATKNIFDSSVFKNYREILSQRIQC